MLKLVLLYKYDTDNGLLAKGYYQQFFAKLHEIPHICASME